MNNNSTLGRGRYSSLADYGHGVFFTLGRGIKAATYTQNKRTQTSMHQVGFQPTNPVFERGKTVHALNRAAAVIGRGYHEDTKIQSPKNIRKD
jgi:hypothetical protein